MSGRVDARLAELGIVLPQPVAPVANYVAFVVVGGLVTLSGQLPMEGGAVAVRGRLGEDVSVEEGTRAARLCLVNLLAQVRAACGGDLDRVVRVVRLGGFIAATPGFTAHAPVMNGASDLAVAVFGDAGRHARSTVGWRRCRWGRQSRSRGCSRSRRGEARGAVTFNRRDFRPAADRFGLDILLPAEALRRAR